MAGKQEKPEFWEINFNEKKEMWGLTPAKSAFIANDFFLKHSTKNVLVPGFGYGRNAQLFAENGMTVTGIEISATAIEIAVKHYGTSMTIYHDSVGNMPLDTEKYDGIFCYALIHLLDAQEREKLIRDCYEQLTDDGYMLFTVISKQAHTYGTGKQIGKDRFELFGAVNMYFYDEQSVQDEFGNYGLFEITEIEEQYPFYLIKCKKSN